MAKTIKKLPKQTKGDKAVAEAKQLVKAKSAELKERRIAEQRLEKENKEYEERMQKLVNQQNRKAYYRGLAAGFINESIFSDSTVCGSLIIRANCEYRDRKGTIRLWQKGQMLIKYSDGSVGSMDGRRGYCVNGATIF